MRTLAERTTSDDSPRRSAPGSSDAPPAWESGRRRRAATAVRLNALLDVIGRRFSESNLSLTKIARSQNISPRYLQYLLEPTGKPFSAHVNALRLARAHALLQDGSDKRRIAEIALAAGFPDASYFNRLFRARFGATPRAVRSAARRAANR